MVTTDPIRQSVVDGELIADRNEWGAQYLISSGVGAETRELAAPTVAGQRLDLCFVTDGGGDVVVNAPAGQTLDGTGDQATFATAGQILVLESFYVAPGDLQWRVTTNIGTVAIA